MSVLLVDEGRVRKKSFGKRGNGKIKAFLERMGNFNRLLSFIFVVISRRRVFTKS